MAKSNLYTPGGRAGNLVFYEYRGIPCMRSVPGIVRQTKATKASAKLFGVASSMSAALRSGLGYHLPVSKEKNIQYGFNKILVQWLKNNRPQGKGLVAGLLPVKGFEFNESATLSLHLRATVMADWSRANRVTVRIPAIVPARDIIAPAQTRKVFCKVVAVSCAVDNPSVNQQHVAADIELSYNQTAVAVRQIDLPFSLSRGQLGIVVVSLEYGFAQADQAAATTPWKWRSANIADAAYFG